MIPASNHQIRFNKNNTAMKKVRVFVLGGLLGFAVTSYGQDRTIDAASNVERMHRVDRVQQARIQQARVKQIRLDQADLTQQRIDQARVKQARIENARHKQQRIKHARMKEVRADAATDNSQVNRRRYHKAKQQAKRKRLANQSEETGGN